MVRLYGSLGAYTEAPNPTSLRRVESLSVELKALLDQVSGIWDDDVPSLNRLMNQHNVPLIRPPRAEKPTD
jgi:hypothetical protein